MDFKNEISNLIGQALQVEGEEITLTVPPSKELGDYAFPCFKLAKAMRKSPHVIAGELAEKIEKPDFISDISVDAAYVNFRLNRSFFISSTLEEVLESKEGYGKSTMGEDKTVIIDFSSPNIAKPFHVGHLRSTVIGGALYRIYDALGYKPFGINHLGDWGTQFGKLITAYKKWGNKEEVEKDGIEELTRLYVVFHDEAEKNPELDDEARAWFMKMQTGDEEALSLWNWFYEISIKEFNKVYEMLGVSFDAFTGESFYNDKIDDVVKELKEKDLLKSSRGAQVVELEEFNMNPCLIVRSDGGSLYATRDISAALYRKKTYDFHKALYLTAIDQNLHFAQFFKVLEKMGYEWSKDMIHVPFGLVSLETGKLSTRKGNVVLMEDLLNEAIHKTRTIMEEKNPNLEQKDEVAKIVGIGAVIFNDLYNGRIKDITFSWDRILNFDGETGPYVQFNYVRAKSLIKKSGKTMEEIISTKFDAEAITNDSSMEVVKLLYDYPAKISEAAEKNEPSVISRHIMAIAQAFNHFYIDRDNEILNAEESKKSARLALVCATALVLKSGLALLGIGAPEQM